MKEQLADKIATAIAEMTSAEKALAEVLREIRAEPRAAKTWTISKAVEDAFARLKVAKENLLDLERLAKQRGG
jgi:hypothetical protein